MNPLLRSVIRPISIQPSVASTAVRTVARLEPRDRIVSAADLGGVSESVLCMAGPRRSSRGCANDKDGARGVTHDALCHAAQERALETVTSVTADHDDVRWPLFGGLDDL